jgi:hypothetical protein
MCAQLCYACKSTADISLVASCVNRYKIKLLECPRYCALRCLGAFRLLFFGHGRAAAHRISSRMPHARHARRARGPPEKKRPLNNEQTGFLTTHPSRCSPPAPPLPPPPSPSPPHTRTPTSPPHPSCWRHRGPPPLHPPPPPHPHPPLSLPLPFPHDVPHPPPFPSPSPPPSLGPLTPVAAVWPWRWRNFTPTSFR